ncbi:hypothetical protein [Burkholderia lata]|uniref:hypothetical protein n=1 Tax=Burkholderia lata (strain ATCC 17760 / DSM 23089 / LMG 22485 / NCIMB 9086 / R18194 / 383) TaxID=482957 RepID=UPI0015842444|nr:hypothetical protein [Burkholderia lata]
MPDAKPQKGRRAEPGEIDIGRVREALRQRLPSGTRIDVKPGYRRGMAYVTIVTADPGYAFTQLDELVALLGATLSVGVHEVDPLAFAVRRVIADVRS